MDRVRMPTGRTLRAGFVYSADFRETVYKITPDGSVSIFATGPYGASGIATGTQGDRLYVNDFINRSAPTVAIEIFKLNVEAYPKAWNVYDSLGEAYMNAGNKERAIENYEKSIEINPDNTNGIDMLEKLRGGR